MNYDDYLNFVKKYEWRDPFVDDLYEQLIKQKKSEDMHYNNRNTRGDEVATIVLEAYANGVEFETLIKKNSTIRQYWRQVQADRIYQEARRLKERARLEKLAEKRKEAAAKKAEAMAKLTPEEIEAFGLKNGKK